jgi:outer membrane receptor for ferrienterochelin and colicins
VSPLGRRWAVIVALAASAQPPSAQPPGAKPPSVYTGRVVDAVSGSPLPLVRVSLAQSGHTVATDSLGRFRLVADTKDPVRLRFRRLGYLPVDREARAAIAVELRMEPVSTSLEATVVTAARREERLADAVVATEVISAQEIARSGAADIAALLEGQVGVQPDGGIPAGVGVALQGLGAQRVLVLMDGLPVVGRVGGNLDLTRLPLAMVDRVEVVKGPQSTLYGSDAMGGVINLVTRGVGEATPSAGIESTFGSLARREVNAHVAVGGAAWNGRIDGGGSVVALAPGVASDAGTRARRVHIAPRLSWSDTASAWSATATALLVDESQRYRSGQLYNFSDNSQINARLALRRRRGAGQFEPTLGLSRYEHLSRRATTPLPASDSGAVDLQQLVQVEAPATFAFAWGVADAGLVLRRESIRADRVPGGERILHSGEPYLQGTWAQGPITWTTGARLSVHERWGTFFAPRAALLWRANDQVAIRVGAGTGYRAPDFKELYLSFANTAAGYAVEGNPELVPERSASGSINLTFTGARASARIGAHRTAYRDFIETGAADASGTYTYGNIARGSTAGIEWDGRVLLGAWRFSASHAWLHTRDEATGSPLLGRAAHTASLMASRRILEAEVGLRAHWTGRAPVGRDETTGALTYRADLLRVDATGSLELPRGVIARAGVTNLLDRTADATWPGFTGRQAYVGLSATYSRREP